MSEDNLIKLAIGVLGLIGTLVGALLGYVSRSKKQAVIDAKREQEQADNFTRLFQDMDGIKKRLDIHNKYAEKFSDIDKSLITIKKDIEYLAPLVTFDNFKKGFTTEGMTLDDMIKLAKKNGATEEEIEKLQHKLTYKYVKGGVILADTDFTIK